MVHAIRLLGLPAGGRFLVDPLWQLVRVGQLDVTAGLAFDPLAAALVTLVSVLATAASVSLAKSAAARTPDGAVRLFGSLCGFVFFLLIVLLADNFFLVLIGLDGLALVGLALAAPPASSDEAISRGFVLRRAGEAGVVLGIALLFWGLGGSWPRGEGYISDLDARISAVSVSTADSPAPLADDPALRGAAATKGKGFLTVTGLPGALVYMDESRAPLLDDTGLPLSTPFHRHEIDGGTHSFRVAPDDRFRVVEAKLPYVLEGGVLTNYTVGRFAFGGGREIALAIMGPTLSFRELSDELSVSSVKGGQPVRQRLVAARLWGMVGVAIVACLLLLLGGTAKAAEPWLSLASEAAAGREVERAALLPALGIAAAVAYLVARLWFVFSLSAVTMVAVAIVGLGALASSGSILSRTSRRSAR